MSRTIERKALRALRREARQVGPVIIESINLQTFGWRLRFAWKVLRAKTHPHDLGDLEDPNAPRKKTVMLPHKVSNAA